MCYSKAKRGVDSFMCTVWSGLSCYQAHTADNSKITHSHTHIQLHVNINCSRELPNYKEVTLPRWFFKSVLYRDISFILFCNSRKLLRADIPSASYFMLIWKNAVLFWHHTLTEQMFFCWGCIYIWNPTVCCGLSKYTSQWKYSWYVYSTSNANCTVHNVQF